jgi:hypothetical protein
LRSKRDALVAHGVSLGEERGKISFSAHTGDKTARSKLDKLNADLALHDSELCSLDAAISESAVRVERARQAQARAVDRQRAEEAQTLVRELSEVFVYTDRHLMAALKGLIAIERGITEVAGLTILFQDCRHLAFSSSQKRCLLP